VDDKKDTLSAQLMNVFGDLLLFRMRSYEVQGCRVLTTEPVQAYYLRPGQALPYYCNPLGSHKQDLLSWQGPRGKGTASWVGSGYRGPVRKEGCQWEWWEREKGKSRLGLRC
jgi:hypothetical protein